MGNDERPKLLHESFERPALHLADDELHDLLPAAQARNDRARVVLAG